VSSEIDCVISLDDSVREQLATKSLEAHDVKLSELLIAATSRCLARMTKQGDVDLHVVYDYRWIDTSLKHTAGALTATYRLPSAILASDNLQEIQGLLKDLPAGGCTATSPTHGSNARQMLLNLEYIQDEPWLGGDEWTPLGFLRIGDYSADAYSLEIIPVFTKTTIEVHLKGRDELEIKELTGLLTENLASELQHSLESSEELAVAM